MVVSRPTAAASAAAPTISIPATTRLAPSFASAFETADATAAVSFADAARFVVLAGALVDALVDALALAFGPVAFALVAFAADVLVVVRGLAGMRVTSVWSIVPCER
jgi:hypothetical protein